eukprot:20364-Heterococcus_DN1.PRE.4
MPIVLLKSSTDVAASKQDTSVKMQATSVTVLALTGSMTVPWSAADAHGSCTAHPIYIYIMALCIRDGK